MSTTAKLAYTVTEYCEAMSLSRNHVYMLIREHRIPTFDPYFVGRKHLIPVVWADEQIAKALSEVKAN